MTVCWPAQVSEVVRGTERVDTGLEMSFGVEIGLGASMLLIYEPGQNNCGLDVGSKGKLLFSERALAIPFPSSPFRIRLDMRTVQFTSAAIRQISSAHFWVSAYCKCILELAFLS